MAQCEGRLETGEPCPRLLGPGDGTHCPAHRNQRNKERAFWVKVGTCVLGLVAIILRRNRSP